MPWDAKSYCICPQACKRMSKPWEPHCGRQQACRRMSTSGQPTATQPYKPHTWWARLLYPPPDIPTRAYKVLGHFPDDSRHSADQVTHMSEMFRYSVYCAVTTDEKDREGQARYGYVQEMLKLEKVESSRRVERVEWGFWMPAMLRRSHCLNMLKPHFTCR